MKSFLIVFFLAFQYTSVKSQTKLFLGFTRSAIEDSLSKKDIMFRGVKYTDYGNPYLTYYPDRSKSGRIVEHAFERIVAYYFDSDNICRMIIKELPIRNLDTVMTVLNSSKEITRVGPFKWAQASSGLNVSVDQDEKKGIFTIFYSLTK